MVVSNVQAFPGFLTPVLTQLFFQSHRSLFSYASAKVRGGNTSERKFASTGSRTHNRQVMSPTPSPLSHPGGAKQTLTCHKIEKAYTAAGFKHWKKATDRFSEHGNSECHREVFERE